MEYMYKYQVHGLGIKENVINAATKREADWKFLRHLEVQYGANFSVNVVRNFIEKVHVSIYGDICISFVNAKNEEFFCTVYNLKKNLNR